MHVAVHDDPAAAISVMNGASSPIGDVGHCTCQLDPTTSHENHDLAVPYRFFVRSQYLRGHWTSIGDTANMLQDATNNPDS
jgi:hypothetical protein